jgi:hypothetical protein
MKIDKNKKLLTVWYFVKTLYVWMNRILRVRGNHIIL